METNQLIIKETAKFFKDENDFNSLDEIKNKYQVGDKEFNLITQIITNRVDPISWIKNNLWINHPNKGIIRFNMYKFQEDFINLWLSKHLLITLKSRQIGISTVTQAICLWAALHYQQFRIVILSAGDRNAKKFFKLIKFMYENLENNDLKLKTKTSNDHEIEFENGSTITALPGTGSSARGLACNLLVIDEAAFIEHIDDVFQATYPVLSRAFPSPDDPNNKPYGVIVISTPCGITGTGQWYYETYTGALNKENDFIPVRLHWSLVPEFDKLWYINMCKGFKFDKKKIASELDLSFVASGDTYIPNEILDTIDTIDPISKDIENNLWVWEEPKENEFYCIGVDVGFGLKKDSSVIQIIKTSTLEQVAEYESNSITVQDFAEVLLTICDMYKNHLCNIETNGPGHILIDELEKRTNFIGINLFRDVNPGELLYKDQTSKDKIGTSVTASNRKFLLDVMKEILIENYVEALKEISSVEEDKIDIEKAIQAIDEALGNNGKEVKTSITKKLGIIKSERLLIQLLGFSEDSKGKVQADHDDLIFGWTHALYCYSKSRPAALERLLNSYADTEEVFSHREQTRRTIDFMRKSGSKIWNMYSPDQLEDIMEEEYEEKQRLGRLKMLEEQLNNDDMKKEMDRQKRNSEEMMGILDML